MAHESEDLTFKHSRFPGGRGIVARNAPIDDIDKLIDKISAETGVGSEVVQKILAMAYRSTERFVSLQHLRSQRSELSKQIEELGRRMEQAQGVRLAKLEISY